MEHYSLQIESEISEQIKVVLEDFWLVHDNKFKFKVQEISVKYNLRINELYQLVKTYSVLIVHGACSKCPNAYIREIKKRSDLKFGSAVICDSCQAKFDAEREQRIKEIEEQERERNEKIRQERITKLKEGIQNKSWLSLNASEMNVLRQIIQVKDLRLIKKVVFKGDFRDRKVWNVVNKLEWLGLIDVERDRFRSVENFHFDPDLGKFLQPSEANQSRKTLSFSIPKKLHKEKPTTPDYAGTFCLLEDVVLQAGVKYLVGGWLQTDGSLSIKFTPSENITSVKETTLQEEPLHIRNIIEQMYNDLSLDDINKKIK